MRYASILVIALIVGCSQTKSEIEVAESAARSAELEYSKLLDARDRELELAKDSGRQLIEARFAEAIGLARKEYDETSEMYKSLLRKKIEAENNAKLGITPERAATIARQQAVIEKKSSVEFLEKKLAIVTSTLSSLATTMEQNAKLKKTVDRQLMQYEDLASQLGKRGEQLNDATKNHVQQLKQTAETLAGSQRQVDELVRESKELEREIETARMELQKLELALSNSLQ